MAFLFGSWAKGREIAVSDVDIAVYFIPSSRELEWEETKEYPGEDALWVEIEKILEKDVDLVVLNRAPTILAAQIMRAGVPIIIKDRNLYWRLLSLFTDSAEYFSQILNDWWVIRERSRSLSEADAQRLKYVLSFLGAELKDQPRFSEITQQNYEQNNSIRREAERWVENINNAAIDIAKILLASQKKELPETYASILSALEGFPASAAQQLAEFAKLRNILAHEYLDLRFKKIKRFIDAAPELYSKLLNYAKSFL